MKRIAVLLNAVLVASLTLFVPAQSHAGVNVNINIPLPGLVFGAPPAMAVIPGTYVYFAPDADANLFFYRGYWYRPYNGRWYLSVSFNGPWGYVAFDRVPRAVIDVPPAYRSMPPAYRPMPYGLVRRNWRTWEAERHWDAGGDGYESPSPVYRRGGMGMGMGR